MPKKWSLLQSAPEKFIAAQKHPMLAQLLYNRGLLEPERIEQFLHPAYERMHDPFIFRDMRNSVDRIWQAIEQSESIVIYSDYDADGVTAAAVLLQTFRHLGVPATSYTPDRFSEGYGLNLEAFKELKSKGAQVVISVDCGTNSVDVANFCKENNIDLIVTDHHEITGEVPVAFSLINPKNPNEQYPDDQITGVGVAYKLAVALLSNIEKVKARREAVNQPYVEHWDKWLLDLVVIGTIADCHSLFGENRIMVTWGLKVLAKTRWVGLQMLMSQISANGNRVLNIDAYFVGFQLAPRINAAGRLEHASVALELLLSEDVAEAQKLASVLDKINVRRQDLTARLVSEAKEQAVLSDRKIVIVSSPDWHKGVVGLVAGRLASDLNKPAIVLEEGENELTGSARSVGNFDIVEALKSAREYMVKFGGHKQAAGLTVKKDKYNEFKKAIIDYAEANLRDEDLQVPLELDAKLGGGDITVDVFDIISELEPFGFGNNKPKFLVERAEVVSLRCVGKEQKHLQMAVRINGELVETIAFNMAYWCDTLKEKDVVDIAAELIADSWNGFRKAKLRIVELKVSN